MLYCMKPGDRIKKYRRDHEWATEDVRMLEIIHFEDGEELPFGFNCGAAAFILEIAAHDALVEMDEKVETQPGILGTGAGAVFLNDWVLKQGEQNRWIVDWAKTLIKLALEQRKYVVEAVNLLPKSIQFI